MATELIITSVPKGLKPGSYGFCTAACTKDLNEPTSRALEVISGYRHLFSPEEGKANPVAFSYLLYEFAGRQRRVLSRVADMGLDYSGRTNKIAHHLVLSEEEAKRPAGPAALCASGVFMERWPEDEQPHYLDARTVSCSESINVNAIKTGAWQKLTGDSGWAGVLAGTVLTRRPVILIVRPDQDVLTLFREALVLLKPEERWKATFSTYYTSLPANAQCQWRALVDGAYDEKLLRIPNAITLDLRNPSALPRVDEIALTPQEKPLVDLARGAASASAEAPQSWEPLGLTPEEAPKSRAPGGGPNPFNRKDDVFFGSVDNGDNSTLGEGYKPDGSTGVSYMPPSHKKSGMIWVLIGFLAGLVILAIVALAFWFTVGNKKDGETSELPAVPGAAGQDSPDGKEQKSAKNNLADSSESAENGAKVPSVDLTGKNNEEGKASEDEPESPGLQDAGADKGDSSQKEEPDESETGEADNPPNAESEQHTAKPIVVELEEQWNKLKEEKNFEQTVSFVAEKQKEIVNLNGRISNAKTFLKSYKERKPGDLKSITDLCDEIVKAQEDSEFLAKSFDLEFYQKECEFASEGMELIIKLYKDAWFDEKLEHKSSSIGGMNDVLAQSFFPQEDNIRFSDGSDDAKRDEDIKKLAEGLKPIKKMVNDSFQQSKGNEFSEELSKIGDKVSVFSEMRLELEKEILRFIVQTVDSENSFSVFTKNPKNQDPKPVKIDGKKQDVYSWYTVGDNKETAFGKGMAAYVNYCMNSQNRWACSLTFSFNKTRDIDALDKGDPVVFLPSETDGKSFSVNINGVPVLLGIKRMIEKGHEGSLAFYIDDQNSIPAILHSARVCISFTSKGNPEPQNFESKFCQLFKPVDMTKTAVIAADEFLTSCEYITEADYEKIESISKKTELEESDKLFCIVTCDKEGKVRDKSDAFSLKMELADSSEKNSDVESEVFKGRRIHLEFSRTGEINQNNEVFTIVYKKVYAHSIFNTLRKFSSDYENGWSLEDEKTTSPDTSDVVVDGAYVNETLARWQKEFGTGNLLFYLVRPDEETSREDWILYGKAPYGVMILSDSNNDQNQTDDQTNSK